MKDCFFEQSFFIIFTKNYFMKKIFYFLLFFISLFSNAQILDKYPENQSFYNGGLEKFYSDIHKVIFDKKISACENKNEIYFAKILVTKDNKVKFVKDFDSIAIAKNKCAYDLTLLVLKEIDGFKAAEVKGYKVSSITNFILFPNDLFENYKETYNPNNYLVEPVYAKGKEKFKTDFHDNFMSLFDDYHVNGDLILDFTINEDGKIVNPNISPKIDNTLFAREFVRTLARLDKKWKPALYRDIPVKYQFSIPMRFSVEFQER